MILLHLNIKILRNRNHGLWVLQQELSRGAWRKFINEFLWKMSVKKKKKKENREKSKQSTHRVMSYHQEFLLLRFWFFWFNVYIFLAFILIWLCSEGRELFVQVTYLYLRVWAGSLPLLETVSTSRCLHSFLVSAVCRTLVFSCCIPELLSWSTAPGVKLLPHTGTTAPRKWHLDLLSCSRHSSPSGSSLVVTSTLEKQSSCWLGCWVQFPDLMSAFWLGITFSGWSSHPGQHDDISAPAAPSSPVFRGFQPHCGDSSAASVNQSWLQFTFIRQPKMVPVLMWVRALSHLLIFS